MMYCGKKVGVPYDMERMVQTAFLLFFNFFYFKSYKVVKHLVLLGIPSHNGVTYFSPVKPLQYLDMSFPSIRPSKMKNLLNPPRGFKRVIIKGSSEEF